MSGSAPRPKLPDDPALHMCALAYASDFSLLDAVMARYGRTLFDKRMMPASLDHAMWFHRPFRADEWLLYAQDSPSAQGGRGLTRGLIFKPDGTLVARSRRKARCASAGAIEVGTAITRQTPCETAYARCVRSTSANCETYQRAYQRSTHGIGMMNTQPITNTRVRHSTSRPVALKMISRWVPSMLRQIQRIQAVMTQAQPMMVMKEMYSSTYQPI